MRFELVANTIVVIFVHRYSVVTLYSVTDVTMTDKNN